MCVCVCLSVRLPVCLSVRERVCVPRACVLVRVVLVPGNSVIRYVVIHYEQPLKNITGQRQQLSVERPGLVSY